MDIKILTSDDPDDTSMIVNGVVDGNDIIVNPAIISSDGATISGIGGIFSDKDQLVSYRIYVYNNSEYDAYLKSVEFLNYNGTDKNKVCTAMEGTTQSLVDEACEDIHVGIMESNFQIFDSGMSDISVYISAGAIIPIDVILVYAGETLSEPFGVGTSLLPNGDFKVNFGNMKFSFSSLES